VKKIKCSVILSQPHGLLPAERVAVRGHHAESAQFDYRHFYDFHEGGERKFAWSAIQVYPGGCQACHHPVWHRLRSAVYPVCVDIESGTPSLRPIEQGRLDQERHAAPSDGKICRRGCEYLPEGEAEVAWFVEQPPTMGGLFPADLQLESDRRRMASWT
jgi:hypothetical protein